MGSVASLALSLLASLVLVVSGASAADFPKGPDARMTPGSVCRNSNTHRYPERILYCERNVDSQEKWQIIEAYNRELGFRITAANRQQFKIDHYIPLCAGGSNDPSNLWPQHVSVYTITDPLEGLMCEKMKFGRLKQNKAIELIREAKNNLSQVPRIFSYLSGL